jgi:glycosyltransferase involved in cell wall biosynthesis
MAPTVSVIVPSYEHESFVGEAIESVLSQSWHDLELLVTDDASHDGTIDVLREFKDVRLSFEVFDRNRGASAAINAALRRAQGEFVCFLGSDDRFLPGKIELQVGFMRANPQIAALFGLPKFMLMAGRSRLPRAPGTMSSGRRSRSSFVPGTSGFDASSCAAIAFASRPPWCDGTC